MAGHEQHPHPIPNAALDAFDLGSREYVLGNNSESLAHFERAVGLHSDFSDAYYMLGMALIRLERIDEGIAALTKAAEMTGNTLLKEYAERKIAAVGNRTVPGVKDKPGG